MVAYKIAPPYPPFDYGSTVRAKVNPNPHGFVQGCIFGFRVVERIAVSGDAPSGTSVPLVENELGDSFEIPIAELDLM
jgi:hypothetical protein